MTELEAHSPQKDLLWRPLLNIKEGWAKGDGSAHFSGAFVINDILGTYAKCECSLLCSFTALKSIRILDTMGSDFLSADRV